jgi:sulfur-oxidizing protein SoxA
VRIAFFLVAVLAFGPARASESARPSPLRSGIEFQSADVRSLQSDDFANPGMLWVDRGAKLWNEAAAPGGKACASCHGDASKSMKGVAARYPRFDTGLGRVVNLEARIGTCRRVNQGAGGFAPESAELVALTMLVAHQSRGEPVAVSVEGGAGPVFERGRALFHTRIGQMNLACTHCHDRQWGRTLLAEPISQGHPTGWPAYRLEWQGAGSLERRLRACFYGVRAEQPAFGSEDLVALELYLAWRAQGLRIEVPGVRR